MLDELRIRGLGVIEDATLDLAPGLNVVTGETGAGKTMVVSGLGLLLGARADAGLVRSGSDRVLVEGRFLIGPDHPLAERVEDIGGDLDGDALLVGRSVAAGGRSRAFAAGVGVPVTTLTELAQSLVAVHGQGDQQRLLSRPRQRDALDRYAGADVAGPLAAYEEVFSRLSVVERDLDEITRTRRAREQEASLLRHGVDEIDRAEPAAGEDAALAAEAERLEHAEGLRAAADSAHAALVGDDTVDAMDAATLLGQARKALEGARSHDVVLGEWAERLADAAYVVDDVAAELASYRDRTESDPVRLESVQERRSVLGALVRRYPETDSGVDAVLVWREQAAQRLLDLEDDDGRIESLSAERAELRQRLAGLAGTVSRARHDGAARFSAAVTAELSDLAMPHATLVVEVTRRSDPDGLVVDGEPTSFGPTGIDEVEILLQAHPGSAARPLAKGASGGELSRVMLAVEVVFAGADPVPTFVFDEVDAGVGGRAAVEVGRRLARLARTAQVLVVTHLPQVAAFADRHWVVDKNDVGAVTRSDVHALDRSARVEELARMLAGLADSERGKAHAEELLALAESERTGG